MFPISSKNLAVAASILAIIVTGGFLSFFAFRDTISLVYWRIRFFRLPRATGSGPKEILTKTANGVAVSLVGISEKEWQVSRKWVPLRQTTTVSSSCLLATFGCWWDNSWLVTPPPSDSNGNFSNSMVRTVGLADAPVQTQICHQNCAATGEHVITPQPVGARGDGFFLVLKIEGIDTNSPICDVGQARQSHAYVGANDPNSIESISVSTEHATAEVGDLAVAIFIVDSCNNPDIEMSLPEGWTSIGSNSVAIQNIGYRACCRVVTETGRQTVACRWKDNSSFAAEGGLVIYKAEKSLAR